MEPQSAEQVTGWVAQVLSVMGMLATPPGVGLIVNLLIVQSIEAWDHLLPVKMLRPGTKDVNRAMAITLSIGLSIPVCAAVMWMAHMDVRGVNFLYGIIGGLGGVIVSALLDKMGLNLDRLFGQDDPPPKP